MNIRLAAFHHEALNLNGDLQNLLILSRRLNLLGFNCEVIELNGSTFETELAKGVDLALVGHGSTAAWANIQNSDSFFESAVLGLADKNVPLLAVASGFEMCVRFGLFECAIQRQERISKFVNFEWNSLQLIGYMNSDSGLPPFILNNSSFGTLLHGPLLAKNPALADFFIQQILSNRGFQKSNLGADALTNLDQIAAQARKVAASMIEG